MMMLSIRTFQDPFWNLSGSQRGEEMCVGDYEVGLGFLVPFLWVIGLTLFEPALVSLLLG